MSESEWAEVLAEHSAFEVELAELKLWLEEVEPLVGQAGEAIAAFGPEEWSLDRVSAPEWEMDENGLPNEIVTAAAWIHGVTGESKVTWIRGPLGLQLGSLFDILFEYKCAKLRCSLPPLDLL